MINLVTRYLKKKKGECVLILGPELMLSEQPDISMLRSLQIEIQQQLSEEQGHEIEIDDDGFIGKESALSMRRFYAMYLEEKLEALQDNLPEFYSQLSQMPFHLILSASPDEFIKKAYEENGLDYQFAYHYGEANSALAENASTAKPIIYNLFGKAGDEESLILSQNDMIDFIFSVKDGERKMPDLVKHSIKKARSFLFLGFDMTRWYMRLIVRLLGLMGTNADKAYYFLNEIQDPTHHNFYTNSFDVGIFDDNSETVIEELYDSLDQHLKPINKRKGNPTYQRLKNLSRKADFSELHLILDQVLDTLAKDGNLEVGQEQNHSIMMAGRQADLSTAIKEGTLSIDQQLFNKSQLRERFNLLLDQMAEDGFFTRYDELNPSE